MIDAKRAVGESDLAMYPAHGYAVFIASRSLTLSATDVAKLEQENARLSVALSDAYAVLGKTKTALEQLHAEYDALSPGCWSTSLRITCPCTARHVQKNISDDLLYT